MKVAILYVRNQKLASKWALACATKGIEHKSFDISKNKWMQEILEYDADLLLLRPPGDIELNKTMFDERVGTLVYCLGMKSFPSMKELLIYENKKLLSYYLEANNIPHPQTCVFYDKSEAQQFFDSSKFPMVLKSSIGASGSGVVICKTKTCAQSYVKRAFSKKGISMRVGPNRVTGNVWKWIRKALHSPSYASTRISEYRGISKGRQRNFVITQEYIEHDFEWRAVKIGDSYFAHKKTKFNEKCSGTKGIDYVTPPMSLLDFTRNICESNGLNSVAIDIFEHDGGYFVNEIQAIFGHVQTHILEVDGKPGRYLYQNGQWVFEEGMFNTNESYDLRLETALKLYGKR